MDGVLRHSGELLAKDAVLMSVFTGLVWREGPFVFKIRSLVKIIRIRVSLDLD